MPPGVFSPFRRCPQSMPPDLDGIWLTSSLSRHYFHENGWVGCLEIQSECRWSLVATVAWKPGHVTGDIVSIAVRGTIGGCSSTAVTTSARRPLPLWRNSSPRFCKPTCGGVNASLRRSIRPYFPGYIGPTFTIVCQRQGGGRPGGEQYDTSKEFAQRRGDLVPLPQAFCRGCLSCEVLCLGCQAGDPDVMSFADVGLTKPGTYTCTDTPLFGNRTAFESAHLGNLLFEYRVTRPATG